MPSKLIDSLLRPGHQAVQSLQRLLLAHQLQSQLHCHLWALGSWTTSSWYATLFIIPPDMLMLHLPNHDVVGIKPFDLIAVTIAF